MEPQNTEEKQGDRDYCKSLLVLGLACPSCSLVPFAAMTNQLVSQQYNFTSLRSQLYPVHFLFPVCYLYYEYVRLYKLSNQTAQFFSIKLNTSWCVPEEFELLRANCTHQLQMYLSLKKNI